MAFFRDRGQAGQRLAKALVKYRDRNPVVVALPRGGVVVGAEIARLLGCPLDFVLVRKIGLPGQPELAIAAIVDGVEPHIAVNEDILAALDMTDDEFRRLCSKELAKIERRRALYLKSAARPDLKGKVAIVVDDGIATGATARAALEAIRSRNPARVVLAVPVAPTETLAGLERDVDEVVCLHSLEPFYAIGVYYDDFEQVTDEEVMDILSKLASQPHPTPVETLRRLP